MTMARGARITGEQRQTLAVELRGRYDAGESVRSLADSCGRSYGFVQTLLKEAGTGLRSRGGAMPRTPAEKVPTRVTTQSGVSAEGEAEVPRRASARPRAGSAGGTTRRRTGTAAASSRSRATSTATPPAEVVAGATVLEGARRVLASARGTGVTGIAGAPHDSTTGQGATPAAAGAQQAGTKDAKGKDVKGKDAKGKDAKVKDAKVKGAKVKGAKGKDGKIKDAKVKSVKIKDVEDARSGKGAVVDTIKDAEGGAGKGAKTKNAKTKNAKTKNAKTKNAKTKSAKGEDAKATSGKGAAKGKTAGKKG
ncbi:helix-turn-helix domain-containing protein [Auraticoccus monumenti]|uniref:Helix-turn-helix domain-containing protein n=1 Tax=Auraticoccus monumenti TaxID=675864 RepID=A0A1G7DEE1_9ACTN|nr:helix-turn-helix domain-containing protein [Auraticoccus monumenti]SDE49891.1 hypothetical protein SAMN04489747_3575 [Auraticoccus monumenti]